MLALQCVKSIPSWLLLRSLGSRWSGLCTSRFALLRLRDVEPPRLPGPRWARIQPTLSGVCGSDLASITAEGTPFFAPLTSFPFTFGHEVVGTVEETGAEVRSVRVGDRVVIEPVLHCGVRGVSPPCAACQAGQYGNCVQIAQGDIAPGVQTGYCRDTGGGWSASLVAHELQLHRVPEGLSDRAAVLVEPFACALHAVLRADLSANPTVLILGCGTMGLLAIAAIRSLEAPATVVALAKHPHQQELAKRLGADEIIPAGRGQDEVLCRRTGATTHQPEIGRPTVLGGFDVVFDCVGSPRSLDDALRFTRARGQTMLVGMPGFAKTVDWTTIWYKELQVRGTYTYGIEEHRGERVRTFELALRYLTSRPADFEALVTHSFALTDYRRAIQTALATGPNRSVKTVFDLTQYVP